MLFNSSDFVNASKPYKAVQLFNLTYLGLMSLTYKE